MLNAKGMPQTFVLGDIHGAYRALRQCLERSGFKPESDHLICLGDVADGWPETRQCIDELLKITNLTYILGNHDLFTLEWMESGRIDDLWFQQGGEATLASYQNGVPDSHLTFLRNAKPYFVWDNKLFVHAGIDTTRSVHDQSLHTLLWDRNLARTAIDFFMKGIDGKLTDYEEVYIGHTPTSFGKPVKGCDVWLMDTGAGWAGNLSMMNLKTKEVFLSESAPDLYPGVQGRKKFR